VCCIAPSPRAWLCAQHGRLPQLPGASLLRPQRLRRVRHWRLPVRLRTLMHVCLEEVESGNEGTSLCWYDRHHCFRTSFGQTHFATWTSFSGLLPVDSPGDSPQSHQQELACFVHQFLQRLSSQTFLETKETFLTISSLPFHDRSSRHPLVLRHFPNVLKLVLYFAKHI
jgi:hypothetical protein